MSALLRAAASLFGVSTPVTDGEKNATKKRKRRNKEPASKKRIKPNDDEIAGCMICGEGCTRPYGSEPLENTCRHAGCQGSQICESCHYRWLKSVHQQELSMGVLEHPESTRRLALDHCCVCKRNFGRFPPKYHEMFKSLGRSAPDWNHFHAHVHVFVHFVDGETFLDEFLGKINLGNTAENVLTRLIDSAKSRHAITDPTGYWELCIDPGPAPANASCKTDTYNLIGPVSGKSLPPARLVLAHTVLNSDANSAVNFVGPLRKAHDDIPMGLFRLRYGDRLLLHRMQH